MLEDSGEATVQSRRTECKNYILGSRHAQEPSRSDGEYLRVGTVILECKKLKAEHAIQTAQYQCEIEGLQSELEFAANTAKREIEALRSELESANMAKGQIS